MNQFMASYAAIAGSGVGGFPLRDELVACAAVLGTLFLALGAAYFRRCLKTGKIGPLRLDMPHDDQTL